MKHKINLLDLIGLYFIYLISINELPVFSGACFICKILTLALFHLLLEYRGRINIDFRP